MSDPKLPAGALRPIEMDIVEDELQRCAEALNVADPPGLGPRTQQELDESEQQSYWTHAIEYGLEYYVAGRFATAHHFNPVSANILHHAVEMLLKACLARTDTIGEIRKYRSKGYAHNIEILWRAFKARQATAPPAEFDEVIEGLHAFENIRYPENLIREGATISIGIFETNGPPIRRLDGRPTGRLYVLQLPKIDRLMGLLFAASGAHPPAFLPRITDDKQALVYYDMVRPTLLGRSDSGR